MLDFVYIVKESDKNDDLRYSLRSIAKFYPDHRVWIVGYKPKWVQNVGYIPVKQTGNKWGNSVKNIIAACESKEISEDFILMNDDFFIIKEKYPLETVCNMNSGTLDKAIKAYDNIKYNSIELMRPIIGILNNNENERCFYIDENEKNGDDYLIDFMIENQLNALSLISITPSGIETDKSFPVYE